VELAPCAELKKNYWLEQSKVDQSHCLKVSNQMTPSRIPMQHSLDASCRSHQCLAVAWNLHYLVASPKKALNRQCLVVAYLKKMLNRQCLAAACPRMLNLQCLVVSSLKRTLNLLLQAVHQDRECQDDIY